MDLDKLADVVIADHARKDSPPGSISWTYIQKSVQKGRLEYEENHRAGPTLHQARAVGSTLPTRIGRTPFTAEDDRILWEWVIRAERKGVSNKGNELYKQLEAKVGCSMIKNMFQYRTNFYSILDIPISHGGIVSSRNLLLSLDPRSQKKSPTMKSKRWPFRQLPYDYQSRLPTATSPRKMISCYRRLMIL